MPGRLIGLLVVAAFAAFVVYMAAQQFGAKCEVCVSFNGRTVCEVALASDREAAQTDAISSACSQLTGGVGELVACTGTPPRSSKCQE